MGWNHRVVHRQDITPSGRTEDTYFITEVYYDDSGNPDGLIDDGVVIQSETVQGLEWVLDRMQEALKKPVLERDGPWGAHGS